MSSAFAIAAITAVLKDLLNDGLADQDLSSVGNVNVSALPPDRIITNSDENSQINLFMYHVTPNTGWSNVGLPSRGANGGGRLSNPPLALDLHYLVTAYGREEFHAEALLGYAMQLLHENPVLTREMINRTLKPPLPAGISLPPGLEMLATSDLAEQVELIKISPVTMSTEEMSKLWTATQARYRPTAAYHISVVLIQATKPVRSALPVLSRGPQDRGPTAQSDLEPPFPTLESIGFPKNQISAQINDPISLLGHHLAGDSADPTKVTLRVVLVHNRLADPIQVDVLAANRTDKSISLTIPDQPLTFYPAGIYAVAAQVEPTGKPLEMQASNELALLVAPKMVQINGAALPALPNPPINIARTGVQNGLGDVLLTLQCTPEVLPEQSVSIVLGSREVPADAHPAQTDTLTFTIGAVAAGAYRLRLRVDGVDSLLIDRSDPRHPIFDESQQINLT